MRPVATSHDTACSTPEIGAATLTGIPVVVSAKLMENAENRESAAEHVGTAMLHEVQCMRVRVRRGKRATPEIGTAKLTGIPAVVRSRS